MQSAGVKMYYVVDNIDAPKAFFSAASQEEAEAYAEAYADANDGTTDPWLRDRSRYVYLLFAFHIPGNVAGRGPIRYHGAMISCNEIHALFGGTDLSSRFHELYAITAKEVFTQIVTHELGHTVKCDHYRQYSGTPALRIRLRPLYTTANAAIWETRPNGSQYNALLKPLPKPLPPTDPDFGLDLYSTANVTIADVKNGINALDTKYEAESPSADALKRAWLLEPGPVAIDKISDGSSSSTWTGILRCSDATSVMTYNRSVEKYKDIHFNNDATSNPFAYGKEIGSMDIKGNHSNHP
jgi:hypothetical protein